MEQRLIYEKDVIEKFAEVQDLRTLSTAVIGKVLKEVPTADPFKHGEWCYAGGNRYSLYYRCSICNAMYEGQPKYCPYCGARMGDE